MNETSASSETRTPETPPPADTVPRKYSWLPMTLVILVSMLSVGIYLQIQSAVEDPGVRPPNRYILPAGFSGKIRILYNYPGAPPLPTEDGERIIEIPMSGMLKTSTPFIYGTATDTMYRRTRDGEMEQLSVAQLEERKSGYIGDDGEFFESPAETGSYRDWMREQGMVDEESNILIGGAESGEEEDMIQYEHIAVRGNL